MASVLILRIFAPKFTHHSGRNPSQKKRGQTLLLWQQPQQTSKWCSQKSCLERRFWPAIFSDLRGHQRCHCLFQSTKSFFLRSPPAGPGAGGLDGLSGDINNVEKVKKTTRVSVTFLPKGPGWFGWWRAGRPAAPDPSPPRCLTLLHHLKEHKKTSGNRRSIIVSEPPSADYFTDDFWEW